MEEKKVETKVTEDQLRTSDGRFATQGQVKLDLLGYKPEDVMNRIVEVAQKIAAELGLDEDKVINDMVRDLKITDGDSKVGNIKSKKELSLKTKELFHQLIGKFRSDNRDAAIKRHLDGFMSRTADEIADNIISRIKDDPEIDQQVHDTFGERFIEALDGLDEKFKLNEDVYNDLDNCLTVFGPQKLVDHFRVWLDKDTLTRCVTDFLKDNDIVEACTCNEAFNGSFSDAIIEWFADHEQAREDLVAYIEREHPELKDELEGSGLKESCNCEEGCDKVTEAEGDEKEFVIGLEGYNAEMWGLMRVKAKSLDEAKKKYIDHMAKEVSEASPDEDYGVEPEDLDLIEKKDEKKVCPECGKEPCVCEKKEIKEDMSVEELKAEIDNCYKAIKEDPSQKQYYEDMIKDLEDKIKRLEKVEETLKEEWDGLVSARDIMEYSNLDKKQAKELADAINETDIYASGFKYKDEMLSRFDWDKEYKELHEAKNESKQVNEDFVEYDVVDTEDDSVWDTFTSYEDAKTCCDDLNTDINGDVSDEQYKIVKHAVKTESKKLKEDSSDNKNDAYYGVFSKGGSISQDNSIPVRVFKDAEKAKLYAKAMRKSLSKGEKSYYGMGYVVRALSSSELDKPAVQDKIKKIVDNLNEDDDLIAGTEEQKVEVKVEVPANVEAEVKVEGEGTAEVKNETEGAAVETKPEEKPAEEVSAEDTTEIGETPVIDEIPEIPTDDAFEDQTVEPVQEDVSELDALVTELGDKLSLGVEEKDMLKSDIQNGRGVNWIDEVKFFGDEDLTNRFKKVAGIETVSLVDETESLKESFNYAKPEQLKDDEVFDSSISAVVPDEE